MEIPVRDKLHQSTEKGWEAGTMTRTEARWGCFLPDLTRLASGASTTSLPLSISSISLAIASQRKNNLLSKVKKQQGGIGVQAFKLDERLENDSVLVTRIGLCQLRLMNDSRWPWLILVPQRPDISELFELTPLDQTMLTFETNLAAEALKKALKPAKINVAAIGNIVRQLHVHVIARYENDGNWPGPVWGFGQRQPYADDARAALMKTVLDAL